MIIYNIARSHIDCYSAVHLMVVEYDMPLQNCLLVCQLIQRGKRKQDYTRVLSQVPALKQVPDILVWGNHRIRSL